VVHQHLATHIGAVAGDEEVEASLVMHHRFAATCSGPDGRAVVPGSGGIGVKGGRGRPSEGQRVDLGAAPGDLAAISVTASLHSTRRFT
jgi:hypothetical protein